MITLATTKHLSVINDIYNQAVAEGWCTAHTEPMSMAERKKWFRRHPPENLPVFIFKESDNVIGWLSVSAYRPGRQALNGVVEISYYVDYAHHGQGIATKLMNHAQDFCRQKQYRILVAILMSGNKPSTAVLEKFGFRECGRIPGAISYRNELRDHLYLCKRLG